MTAQECHILLQVAKEWISDPSLRCVFLLELKQALQKEGISFSDDVFKNWKRGTGQVTVYANGMTVTD
jgi:hypothetical protein